MDGLKISTALILALMLLLPAAYGLDMRMGVSNADKGSSENIKLKVPLEGSVISSTELSPDSHLTDMVIKSEGAYDFDQTFNSLDNGEHVLLTAKMQDSKRFVHSYNIEKQKEDRIRVSQSLSVDQGKYIECTAQAWNSNGQAARVGLKIPAGSLTDYSSYGEATDDAVVADQKAAIPEDVQFALFAQAESGIKNHNIISINQPSNKKLTAMTKVSSKERKIQIFNMVSKDTPNTNSILR